MEYVTREGHRLLLSRIDRRLIDRLSIKRMMPRPPTRTVMAWGDVEEEIPEFDDPTYQAEMMDYRLWLTKEQATIMAQGLTLLNDVDWSELDELLTLGLEMESREAGLLNYLLSDTDSTRIAEQILYHSTVTAQGITEAETAYNVIWLNKPVTAWRVPGIPAEMSLEFEARKVAQIYGHDWPGFCELPGPEQSAIVAHHRLSNKLAWLEAEYERAKRA